MIEFLMPSKRIAVDLRRFTYMMHMVYSIGGIGKLLLAFVFLILKVELLALFFFLSFFLSIGCFLLNRFSMLKSAYGLMVFDALLMMLVALYSLGWASGFHYFFLCLGPGLFLYPKLKLGYKISGAGFISLSAVLLFLWAQTLEPLYENDPLLFYLLNMLLVGSVLAAAAYYYGLATFTSEKVLRKEVELSEWFLKSLLPAKLADEWKEGKVRGGAQFENVGVCFMGIIGLAKLAEEKKPAEFMDLLSDIFGLIDVVVEAHGLERIKTIGDSVLVVAGVPDPLSNRVEQMAVMALKVRHKVQEFCEKKDLKLNIRMGMHMGPVIAGVIGKKRFSYDLWGKTVNLAAKMEAHGVPGEIHVTQDIMLILKDQFIIKDRGEVFIKNVGNMHTYFLVDQNMID